MVVLSSLLLLLLRLHELVRFFNGWGLGGVHLVFSAVVSLLLSIWCLSCGLVGWAR